MRTHELILIVFREHREVVFRQDDIDVAGAFAVLVERLEACGDIHAGSVGAMRPALLDVRLSSDSMGADRWVDPDDGADPVHQGEQLVELLRGNLLVLGAGVAHQLVLVHLLVACQHVRRLMPAPS